MSTPTPRTYIYSKFKQEFSLLGRLHWYYTYSSRLAVDKMDETVGSSNETYVDAQFPASNYDNRRLHITVQEFTEVEDDYASHFRLMLLVNACALLENYLHRFVEYYAISLGYGGTKHNNLSEVGEALIKPASRNNPYTILKYVQHLISVSVSQHLPTLKKAYHVRCMVAHTGGIIDGEAVSNLRLDKSRLGQKFSLTWDELNQYLESIYHSAKIVEESVDPDVLRQIEVQWMIQDVLEIITPDNNLDEAQKFEQLNKSRDILLNEYDYKRVPKARDLLEYFEFRQVSGSKWQWFAK